MKVEGISNANILTRARVDQPETLRALYGLTDTRNSFHGSGT